MLRRFHVANALGSIDCNGIWAVLSRAQNDMYSNKLGLRETCQEYRNGVFWKLLSKPFDKMYMTWGQGQWPRASGKNGFRKVAFLLKKSVLWPLKCTKWIDALIFSLLLRSFIPILFFEKGLTKKTGKRQRGHYSISVKGQMHQCWMYWFSVHKRI